MSITTRRVKSGALRYDVRVKHAGQLVATRTFRRQGDAETWEREQYRALQLGEFLPPSQTATPFSEVVARFEEAGVPAAPVRSTADAVRDRKSVV